MNLPCFCWEIRFIIPVFGQYILPLGIFDVLREYISDEQNQSSEINTKDSLNAFIGKSLTGVILNNAVYDIGNLIAYRESFIS